MERPSDAGVNHAAIEKGLREGKGKQPARIMTGMQQREGRACASEESAGFSRPAEEERRLIRREWGGDVIVHQREIAPLLLRGLGWSRAAESRECAAETSRQWLCC